MGALCEFLDTPPHWFLNELIVLHYLNFIDTEKITWTSISSGLIAIIGLILFYERLIRLLIGF
jgi:hypothetical protein